MWTTADLERVVVVGTSGAGKTTFAREIGAALGVPHVELDALHWGPGWSVRPDFAQRVARAVAAPRWVVDGNYHAVREHVWPRATAFVWLDYDFRQVFMRALQRTARRWWRRETLWAGNRESIARALFDREGLLWWVIRTHARRRRELAALFAGPDFAGMPVLRFTQPHEADTFVRALRAELAAASDAAPLQRA